jgi:periplasmic divalent cation tolerance protein
MIEPGLVEIRTTFASQAAAVACGKHLVEAGVAACVQVDGPLTSIYRWQDVLETSEEWRCSCKTTVAARDACLAAIGRLHEYETPELIVVELAASSAYSAWVRESVVNHAPSSREDTP